MDLVISNMSTAQKMTFSIKNFFSKCKQIHKKLQIWSHVLKKPLMENLKKFFFWEFVHSSIILGVSLNLKKLLHIYVNCKARIVYY